MVFFLKRGGLYRLLLDADVEDERAAAEGDGIAAEEGLGIGGRRCADIADEDHVLGARRTEDVADGGKARGNLADVGERDLWAKARDKQRRPVRL